MWEIDNSIYSRVLFLGRALAAFLHFARKCYNTTKQQRLNLTLAKRERKNPYNPRNKTRRIRDSDVTQSHFILPVAGKRIIRAARLQNTGESAPRKSDLKSSPNRSDFNCTPPADYFFYADLYVVLPVIYSVICAVGLTGNTAVIYVILKAPKMKTVTNMFILNLAIADDLFTLVLPINIAEHLLHYWPFGEVLCKIILSIDHYNIFSSIYFLTVMSVDRYLVVLATVRSKRMPYRTYRAAKIVSLCVWMLVILIVVPFTVFGGVYISPDDSDRKSCVLSFPSPEGLWFKASRIYTLILGFAIPVSTICILYTMMLYKLRNMRLNTNAKALDKAKKKVTIMVFIVLAVCLFCWTPFHLSTIVALTTDLGTTPLVIGISYFITSLSYANSCLNPFLYAFLDDSFRKAFKKMLECKAG
ncbi:Gpr7 [Silurus asotus]|uniref:Gpr7 n=1 Tax=Silurus asotus TaxID=30991 RepID=A0AAD5FE84_SILAS|nr:Gpr7 [Silurus asotus]